MVCQRSIIEICKGLYRTRDLLVAVSERDERRLELRRREVDTPLEQVAEKSPVAVGVRRLRVAQIADRRLAHEQRCHRADPLHGPERSETRLELGAAALELLVVI